MTAVLVVMLLGVGIGALGLVLPDLYVAGLLVLSIGVIGLVVRGTDAVRWIRR